MQFFDRYYREVFAFDEADITARLDNVRGTSPSRS